MFLQNPDNPPRLPEGVDYATLFPPAVLTRSSSGLCHCFLCEKGRNTLRPQAPSSQTVAQKICVECKGHIAPRVVHNCTRAVKQENILGIIRSHSEKSKEQVLSAALKGILKYLN